MNVLLTCVGRRSYMVDYFKQAVGNNGVIIATNNDTNTTGMQAADKHFVVPQINDPKYIDSLLSICQSEDIKLVMSLFDIDLPYLAKARDRFLTIGVEVVVSDPWVVDMANDKWETFIFLTKNSIATPNTFLDLEKVKIALFTGELEFPLIIKPRWGTGSMSIFKAENIEELDFFYKFSKNEITKSYLDILNEGNLDESVVIQEFVSGQEYGLDIFNDLVGNFCCTFVKKKLDMRSGETDSAEVVENERLKALGQKLSKLLKHRGNLDVDILQGADGKFNVLEFNTRFGGGYPFSHLAGANFPKALVQMVRGVKPYFGDCKIGVVGYKNIVPVTYY